jgi:type III secretion protein HrpB1
MDVLKDQAECPPAAVGAIVDLVRAALAAYAGPARIEIDDIEQLVGVLHVMRPNRAEFAFFDGWLMMLREEWSDAAQLFRDLADRSLCLPASRGMLLRCLKAAQEPGWQEEARKLVEEGGDDEVTRLARVLLASDDVKQAVATAKRTGRFVAPDSVREFESGARAEAGGAAAAPSQTTSDMQLVLQYMRI